MSENNVKLGDGVADGLKSEANQELFKGSGLCAPMRAMTLFEKENPEIAKQYFDMRFDDYSLDNLDLR